MRSVADLMNLSGRRALVTGGAGHIGLAAGQALAELGASVAVADLSAAACRERAARLSALNAGRAFPLPFDLSDEAATRRAVRAAIKKMGGLDVVVHCAGYVGDTRVPGWAAPFPEQSVKAWDQGMRVNLTSAFVLAQEAAPALAKSGRGSIIFFSSIYGVVGPDWSLYAGTPIRNPLGYDASKGGLIQLSRALATTLGPKIRVNCISPGGVRRSQPAAFQRRYAARTPLKRMAIEEDLKGAVAYLASDLSGYVTGQNLLIDGGWTAW